MLSAGEWVFSARVSDGVRLWLDGSLIVDAWRDQPTSTFQAARTVNGCEHEIKLDYYEADATATAQVSWQASSTDEPPSPTIFGPAPTLTFKVGDAITYSGSATDLEDGSVPSTSLAWAIILHHCPGIDCHSHPFSNSTGSSGSFTVPDHVMGCTLKSS